MRFLIAFLVLIVAPATSALAGCSPGAMVTMVFAAEAAGDVGQAPDEADPPPFRSVDDLDRFIDGYYRNPQPDRVAEMISFIGERRILRRKPTIPPTVGFLAEVFARNEDRVPEWKRLLDEQDEATRVELRRAFALASDPKRMLGEATPSPALNDAYWGAFFASGDTTYLQRLIDHLGYVTEREDVTLFLAGASAKWSLASNAQSHEVVKSTIEAALSDADGALRDELGDVLGMAPAEIQAETTATLESQKEKGIW